MVLILHHAPMNIRPMINPKSMCEIGAKTGAFTSSGRAEDVMVGICARVEAGVPISVLCLPAWAPRFRKVELAF